jgi:hypothetical protein
MKSSNPEKVLVDDKREAIGQFAFYMAFENTIEPGT